MEIFLSQYLSPTLSSANRRLHQYENTHSYTKTNKALAFMTLSQSFYSQPIC